MKELHKRFLSSKQMHYEDAVRAAKEYVSKLNSEERKIGIMNKPFNPYNLGSTLRYMYELLNILAVLKIPENSRILEVGSGPGWVTEILLKLGYFVDALEPSAEMNDNAKRRISSSLTYQKELTNKVQHHQSTMEEIEFQDETFDIILFFDSLHHVVDEVVAINKSFKFLKKGGFIAVVEGAWKPGNLALEEQLDKEMERFGTLENPFTTDYLNHLLGDAGFVDLKRYVGINGYYTKDQQDSLPSSKIWNSFDHLNNLTARKPA